MSPHPGELASLFDLLVNHYRFVIVDTSSRLDQITKLLSDLSNAVLVIAQTDVVSLWSVGHIRSFLEEGDKQDRIHIVLNGCKKVSGFGDKEGSAIHELQGDMEDSQRFRRRRRFD